MMKTKILHVQQGRVMESGQVCEPASPRILANFPRLLGDLGQMILEPQFAHP